MCSTKIGLQAQNLLTILDAIFNFWGGGGAPLYDRLLTCRIFTLTMNKIFKRAPEITRKVAVGTIWICLWSHTNCMFGPLWDISRYTCTSAPEMIKTFSQIQRTRRHLEISATLWGAASKHTTAREVTWHVEYNGAGGGQRVQIGAIGPHRHQCHHPNAPLDTHTVWKRLPRINGEPHPRPTVVCANSY